MTTRTDDAPRGPEISLDHVVLRPGDHVGVFYRGDKERDAFLLPVIADAIAAGCRVIYVCDRDGPEQVAEQLAAGSTGVDGAIERGQLRLIASREAYLATGIFDPYRMVDFYKNAAEAGYTEDSPIPCVIGEMSWSLRGCPGSERLIEYEALYAKEFADAAVITLCLYDLEQTRGEQIFDLLRLHGRVVLNGIEMHNPRVAPLMLLD
ncbi:MAG: MEDS domain-containing protein [Pseudonocardia sp.]